MKLVLTSFFIVSLRHGGISRLLIMKGLPLKLYQFRVNKECLAATELCMLLFSGIIRTSRELQAVTWLLKIVGHR